MSDLALGDLRLKAAHMLQNPYTRNRGFTMSNKYKKSVKLVSRGLSRKIQSSTHYTVDNELFRLIWKSLKRRSIRHFVNAFDNAMPPHRNFFVEWQMDDGLFGAHVLQEHRKFDHIRENGKKTEYSDPTTRGSIEVISINFYSCSSLGITLMPLEFWISRERGTDFGVHFTSELMSPFLGLSAHEQDNSDLPEDLRRIFKAIHVQPILGHPDYDQFRVNPENFSVMKACRSLGRDHRFEICHQMALMTLTSVISLVNYDWTVDREPGVIVDSVKSVNTSGVAKDQYKQVKLNLPKSKQVLDFFKQKPRTRKFGTAEHVVRGHWRYYKRTGERVWIGEHTRGDSQYGTVYKDYLLTKRDNFLKQTA